MENQTRDNLTDKSTWMRLLYIALFTLAFNIAELLIAITVLVQFFSVLFTKKPNQRLQTLGRDLGAYVQDVVWFLTYQSDHMPYPISDWGPQSASKPASKPSPKPSRKPAAKKNPPADKN
ncbi:DUF4389 domain-containing protein [Magnetovibrio blakemorei]|uniref:Glucose-1-phosphate thymidylyltransferase n=1 Tax=Magnetovibrio blakemorei TaxID=28181 RepID=A0A1E5Q5U4_9PROT|nr:DUF4389 domain-containing protein [Magnetovibrio blakemorei]OEJ65940.1 hypothetical protein BEN30_13110 [Magnetovibrio blakemorei]